MMVSLAPQGEVLMTSVIQEAIDKLATSGGGTLHFPSGLFLSGTLFLASHVHLTFDAGARLKASGSIVDYDPAVHHNRYRNETNIDRCFIFAQDAVDISISGLGTIDGNNEAFEQHGPRPMLLRFLRCRGLSFSGVTLYESAAWNIALLECQDVVVDGIQVFNTKRFNGDGVDMDGCSNVVVMHSLFTTTDDSICLQSSGERCHAVSIHDNVIHSICAGIRIGLKSIGTIEDVTIKDIVMEQVLAEGVKIECSEGGTIRNIAISSIRMHNVRRPLFFLLNNRFLPEGLGSSVELDHMPAIGKLEHISVECVTAYDDDTFLADSWRFHHNIMGSPLFSGVKIDANKDHPLVDVSIRHLRYEAIGSVQSPVSYYPVVPDLLVEHPSVYVENYEPRYSRTCCMDIRNVQGLLLEDIQLSTLHSDVRPYSIVENCVTKV